MNYIVKINSLDDISKLNNATSFLFALKDYSLRYDKSFTIKQIEKETIKLHKENKEVHVLVNKIFYDEDLLKLEDTLKELEKINVDKIYFADFGVFMLAKKIGISDKLVFYHETFLRNSKDVDTYKKLGIKSFCMSKDMNIETIDNLKDSRNLYIVCFGYMPIYYSKRHIIKNFLKVNNIKIDYLNKTNVCLKEETRDDLYPIIETKTETTMFNSIPLCYIDSFFKLNKKIDNFIFDSLFFKASFINDVIDAFINNKKIDIEYTDMFLNKKVGLTK